MKQFLLIFSGLLILFCATNAPALDMTVQTGFNYDWWKCDNDDKGSQFYVPIRIQADYEDFAFNVIASQVATRFDPAIGTDLSISGVVDTKASASYEIIDRLPVDLLIGLDLNIPTGKTGMDDAHIALLHNPDLTDILSIKNLGEGFNVNPTIILSKEWEKWTGGMGLGYVWRGEYDYSKALRDYDPGNILNLSIEADYEINPDWQTRIIGEYVHFGKDKITDEEIFQEGGFVLMGLGLDYTGEMYAVSSTIRNIIRRKNKQPDAEGNSITEEKNSHGNEWLANVSFLYFLNDEITIKSGIQYLYISENEYPTGPDDLFIGKKDKLSLECGIIKSNLFHPALEGEFNINGLVLNTDKTHLHPDEDIRYNGFSIETKLTGRF